MIFKPLFIYSVQTRKGLGNRVESHCGAKLLDAYTRMDLVTLQRKDVQSRIRKMTDTFVGDAVWDKYHAILDHMLVIVEVLSQGLFLLNFFKQQDNGWMLAAVCVLPQLVKALLWNDQFGGGTVDPPSPSHRVNPSSDEIDADSTDSMVRPRIQQRLHPSSFHR
jgi:hypothetical protein